MAWMLQFSSTDPPPHQSINSGMCLCLLSVCVYGGVSLQVAVAGFFPPDSNSEQINLYFSSSECWNSSSVNKTEVTVISVHLKTLVRVLLSHSQNEEKHYHNDWCSSELVMQRSAVMFKNICLCANILVDQSI